jgi:hypothetical protein
LNTRHQAEKTARMKRIAKPRMDLFILHTRPP